MRWNVTNIFAGFLVVVAVLCISWVAIDVMWGAYKMIATGECGVVTLAIAVVDLLFCCAALALFLSALWPVKGRDNELQ